MVKAYSYIRFSSVKQRSGDSLRRQTDLAKAYALKHRLDLDDTTYQDLGMSGFDGTNLARGMLRAFLLGVSNGAIPKGSYLLIETFDRLSRASIPDAFSLLLDLIRAGIVIVTLIDDRVWTIDAINDLPNLMYSIMLMSRAHEESATKSKRLKAAWGKKKSDAAIKKLTAECPMWLELKADRSAFDVLDDKVASVKKVFILRASGLGSGAISRRANLEGWPAPSSSGTWHTSLIGRLLNNRGLLGEYQPHETIEGKRVAVGDVVHGYYPIILTDAEWAAAQAVAQRHAKMPRRRAYRNVFQGLLRCSCGASFVRKNKSSIKNPTYAIYYCTDRLRGVTTCVSIPAPLLEMNLLHHISWISPSSASLGTQAKEIQSKIDELETIVNACNSKLTRLVALAEETDEPISILAKQMNKTQGDLDLADIELANARSALLDLQNFDPDNAFDDMYAVLTNGTDEQRSVLRESMLRILTHIDVYPEDKYMRMFSKIPGYAPFVVPLAGDAKIPGIIITQ